MCNPVPGLRPPPSSKRIALVACSVGLAACATEGGPFYEVSRVTSTCEPRAAEEKALCAVAAEIRTRFPADTLAVVALAEGERRLARAVIPVADGRGVAQWPHVELGSSPPKPHVNVLGTVFEPADAKLTVLDAATTCAVSAEGSESLACRTTGRVECSHPESWLVVIEARSTAPSARWWKRDEGTRAWALVRLAEGKAAFSLDWSRPQGQAHSTAADVLVRGVVGKPAPRG